MSATTITAPGAEAYFKQVKSFEQDRLRGARWHARLAYLGMITALLVAGAEGLALATLVPLKQTELIVLRVNDTTGAVDRVYDVAGGEMAANEAEQRYWLWQYVLHREGYSGSEAQHNFDVVTLMSAPDVQRAYADWFRGSNPTSPQVVLRGGQAVLSWQSTTFIGPNLAQVRYRVIARKGDNVLPRENRVATIGYSFAKGKVEGSALLLNPRGFLVTTYHSDQENVQ